MTRLSHFEFTTANNRLDAVVILILDGQHQSFRKDSCHIIMQRILTQQRRGQRSQQRKYEAIYTNSTGGSDQRGQPQTSDPFAFDLTSRDPGEWEPRQRGPCVRHECSLRANFKACGISALGDWESGTDPFHDSKMRPVHRSQYLLVT